MDRLGDHYDRFCLERLGGHTMTPSMDIRITRGLEDFAPIQRLRYEILRQPLHQDFESARFPGDELESTVHFSANREVELVGCATLVETSSTQQRLYQLRGMAVRTDLQRVGIGGQLLDSIHRWIQDIHAETWCNARESAVPFYQKHGWVTEGTIFEVPGIGPHMKMRYRVPRSIRAFREAD